MGRDSVNVSPHDLQRNSYMGMVLSLVPGFTVARGGMPTMASVFHLVRPDIGPDLGVFAMSRFTKPDLAIMILALLYVLSPVDFIPELITGPIGLTDDMAAIAVIAAIVMRSFSKEPEPAPVVVPGTVTRSDR